MPTRTDSELAQGYHFTRDPSLSASIADAFGGGGGDASALIQANELRRSPELATAQDLPVDPAGLEMFDDDAVASAADIEPEQLLAWDKRGNYVVFAYQGPDGRTGKDVLRVEGESLEQTEQSDSPARAAMRAHAAAARAVMDARTEADKIIAEAQEKAAEILREASESGREEGQQIRQQTADRLAERDDMPDEGSSAMAREQAPTPESHAEAATGRGGRQNAPAEEATAKEQAQAGTSGDTTEDTEGRAQRAAAKRPKNS